MARLTYARLLTRLHTLRDSVPEQLPGYENAQRVKDTQDAINAGIVAAQAGLEGDKSVLKPSDLKYEVSAKLDEIDHRFEREAAVSPSSSLAVAAAGEDEEESENEDADDQLTRDLTAAFETEQRLRWEQSSSHSASGKENPSDTATVSATRAHPARKPANRKKNSAVTKRPIRNPGATTKACIKKSTSKRTTRAKSRIASPTALTTVTNTIEEREAAAALLDLFTSSPLTNNRTNTMHPAYAPNFTSSAQVTPINNMASNKGKQRASSSQPATPLNFPNMHLPITHPNPYRRTFSNAEFLDLPANAIDASAKPEHIFLAGVQFAMQNFTAAHATKFCRNTGDGFADRCYEYVRVELGIKSEYELLVEKYEAEMIAKGAVRNGGESAAGKGFWDVI
ncbi:uncharacterized protein K460DRAFT_356088 [Cucurbitaria berberidis CBS 394.84]|uniref:Uncharacterized protein n=1 Tax=Cucurbitaria berberidis CBS 394.84 TaxID=1168544 RepID=A0A9P4GIS4_9PLEO|nr:uncharacterized protein K460DRAFT_356088 [Cucurbitaria berberidis CBS 394.84]KAF1846407.1 hypothetical protein K460DRAFT_356088 [Cucurbitaria berberidis CBS 394.84]